MSNEIKKCEFEHNQEKLIMQQPIKIVRNDPYPCPDCGIPLYITVERAKMNDLLTVELAWNLIISEEKQPENE